MKTLKDGTEVTSRSYYYLLDFNDYDNWETLQKISGKFKLKDLTFAEYRKLWFLATEKELEKLEG